MRRPGLWAQLAGLRRGAGEPAGLADEDVWVPPGVARVQEQPYGDHPAQRLDVYYPQTPGHGGVMVVVHGGGWRRGDKGHARLVQRKLDHWCARGWVLVAPNYRMLPDAGPRAQAGDVAQALAWVQAHAGRWGADGARTVLMGHSAGAHLVALLAADPDLAQQHGALPWQATVAIDTTAYDVVALMQAPHLPLFDHAFGHDPQAWRLASPLHCLARRGAPPAAPMLLVCSAQRPASCTAAAALAERVLALGGRASVLPVALSHLEINRQLGRDPSYTASVNAFLDDL